MELLKKTVDLEDGIQITVCEADAGYDARLASAMEEANRNEANDLFAFFHKTFYPLLYACSKGEVPGPKESFELPHKKLDEWYLSVWELNPDILGEFKTERRKQDVEFRDGSTITLHETCDLPSYVLRLVELEKGAEAMQDVPADESSFRNYIYPKIAACANGSKIPTADEVIDSYPKSEIAKWSAVAMQLNPNWFQLIFDESERQSKKDEEIKKKSNRRVHYKKGKSARKKGE
jgi:hypothetical protein